MGTVYYIGFGQRALDHADRWGGRLVCNDNTFEFNRQVRRR